MAPVVSENLFEVIAACGHNGLYAIYYDRTDNTFYNLAAEDRYANSTTLNGGMALAWVENGVVFGNMYWMQFVEIFGNTLKVAMTYRMLLDTTIDMVSNYMVDVATRLWSHTYRNRTNKMDDGWLFVQPPMQNIPMWYDGKQIAIINSRTCGLDFRDA